MLNSTFLVCFAKHPNEINKASHHCKCFSVFVAMIKLLRRSLLYGQYLSIYLPTYLLLWGKDNLVTKEEEPL